MSLTTGELLRAKRQAHAILDLYPMDDVTNSSDLVAYVERVTGHPITIRPLPEDLPPQISGLVSLDDTDTAAIYLPAMAGVYSAHVLHHEIGHLLLHDHAVRTGQDDDPAQLACDDEFIERVVEEIAQHLTSRLLRLWAPPLERVLG